MERISIFNYEAYYLDYMEGKLNEEDTSLLFAFLEQHPECKVDDEEFTTLVSEDLSMKSSLKKELMQVDETGSIDLNNVEHFLIAQAEGVLAEEKENELDVFIGKHKLEHEKRLVAATYFNDEKTYVFADKSVLKQSVQVRLWPYAAAAASVLIIVMIYLFGGEASLMEPSQNMLSEEQLSTPVDALENPVPNNEIKNEIGTDRIDDSSPKTPVNSESRDLYKNDLQGTNDVNIALQKMPARQILSPKMNLNPEPLTQQLVSQDPINRQTTNQDYASVHFSEIKNPIKPITKVLSEKTNREIDFRSGKSKTDDSRGFFVKIGKFEFSRKKH